MSDKINKIEIDGITYSISDEEANSRLDSEIQRATSVEEKLQSELGTDQIILIQGGIDEAGNESSNSYFLRTSKLSNFKLEVNSEYTIGQLVQYDLGGNFITIYNGYQELEGITWSKTSISVSDRQYLWIVTIFKGTIPSISIHPSENVVKSFLSGLYLFAGGGVEDNNSSASKAKEIVNNTIEQLPNKEDLVILDDKLQFANRTVVVKNDHVKSLGYVILRQDKSFKDQVIESNTIYEIRYEFNIEEAFKFPDNCVLKFEGGLLNINLSSGTVNFNNLTIDASDEVIIKVSETSTIGGGLNNSEVLAEWFNIIEDGENKRHILNQLFWWVGENQTIRFKKGDAVRIDGGEIRINKNGVTVKDATFNIASCNGLFLVNAENITFDNCRFVGTAGNTCSQIILLGTANNILVANCYFSYVGYAIIQAVGKASNNVTVTGCVAENMTRDFIEANCTRQAPSYNWIIQDNVYLGDVNYPTLKRENRFVGITDVKNVIIKDNIVKRTAGDAAVHIEEADKDVIITGNQFEDCVDKCVWIINANNRAIIANNTFRVTDNALAASKFFTNESSDFLSENFGKHLFVGNYCTGLKATDNYIGSLYCANTVIIDNIFCSIKEINAFTYTEIKNNKFVDCKNCISTKHNSKNISYCGNVDVNTEAYSINIKSVDRDLQNIVLSDNIFSGVVEIGDNSDTCVFDNNIYTTGQYVNIDTPVNKNNDRGVSKNNYIGNCYHDNFIANIEARDGLVNKFSNVIGFDNNRLKYSMHNGQEWIDTHTPHINNYPKICNKGSIFFDESAKLLQICTEVGKRETWSIEAPSVTTAINDGIIKLTLDGNSVSINIKNGETWDSACRRLVLHKLKGAKIVLSNTGTGILIKRLEAKESNDSTAFTVESDVFILEAIHIQDNISPVWQNFATIEKENYFPKTEILNRITNQAEFEDVISTVKKANGNITATIKSGTYYLPMDIDTEYNNYYGNLKLIGDENVTIKPKNNDVYTKSDAIEITDTHYKCILKNYISHRSIFVDKNDKLLPVSQVYNQFNKVCSTNKEVKIHTYQSESGEETKGIIFYLPFDDSGLCDNILTDDTIKQNRYIVRQSVGKREQIIKTHFNESGEEFVKIGNIDYPVKKHIAGKEYIYESLADAQYEVFTPYFGWLDAYWMTCNFFIQGIEEKEVVFINNLTKFVKEDNEGRFILYGDLRQNIKDDNTVTITGTSLDGQTFKVITQKYFRCRDNNSTIGSISHLSNVIRYNRSSNFVLYNLNTIPDHISYDSEFIYIPNKYSSIEVSSYVKRPDLNVSEYAIRVNNASNISISNITFKNFPNLFYVECNTNTENVLTLRDCNFENIIGRVVGFSNSNGKGYIIKNDERYNLSKDSTGYYINLGNENYYVQQYIIYNDITYWAQKDDSDKKYISIDNNTYYISKNYKNEYIDIDDIRYIVKSCIVIDEMKYDINIDQVTKTHKISGCRFINSGIVTSAIRNYFNSTYNNLNNITLSIDNCYFNPNTEGYRYYKSTAANLVLGNKSIIENNEFVNTGCAISLNYGDITISNNKIYNDNEYLKYPERNIRIDTGAIYCDYIGSNNTTIINNTENKALIEHNIIYNMFGQGDFTVGNSGLVAGIYLDSGRGDITIRYNIISGPTWKSVTARNISGQFDGYTTYGIRNILENNILFCPYDIQCGSKVIDNNIPIVKNNYIIGEKMSSECTVTIDKINKIDEKIIDHRSVSFDDGVFKSSNDNKHIFDEIMRSKICFSRFEY